MGSGDDLYWKQIADRERDQKYEGLRKRDYATAALGTSRDAYHHYAKRKEELAGGPVPTAAPPSPPPELAERRARLEAQIAAMSAPAMGRMLMHALLMVDLAGPGAAAQLDEIERRLPPSG